MVKVCFYLILLLVFIAVVIILLLWALVYCSTPEQKAWVWSKIRQTMPSTDAPMNQLVGYPLPREVPAITCPDEQTPDCVAPHVLLEIKSGMSEHGEHVDGWISKLFNYGLLPLDEDVVEGRQRQEQKIVNSVQQHNQDVMKARSEFDKKTSALMQTALQEMEWSDWALGAPRKNVDELLGECAYWRVTGLMDSADSSHSRQLDQPLALGDPLRTWPQPHRPAQSVPKPRRPYPLGRSP